MSSEPLDSPSLGEELERLFEQTPTPDQPSNRTTEPRSAGAAGMPTTSLERVAAALERSVEAAVEQAVAAALGPVLDRLDLSTDRLHDAGRPDWLQEEMDLLRTQLDAAFNDVEAMVRLVATHLREQEQRVGRVEAGLAEVAADVRRVAERIGPTGRTPDPVDLTPLVDRVEHLHETVAAQLADARRQHRADLGQLIDQLDTGSVEVDTRHLEEVVHRGAIANAADIANLSGEFEGLIAVIKAHDTNLSDLRKQIEWIKQRVLSR